MAFLCLLHNDRETSGRNESWRSLCGLYHLYDTGYEVLECETTKSSKGNLTMSLRIHNPMTQIWGEGCQLQEQCRRPVREDPALAAQLLQVSRPT